MREKEKKRVLSLKNNIFYLFQKQRKKKNELLVNIVRIVSHNLKDKSLRA